MESGRRFITAGAGDWPTPIATCTAPHPQAELHAAPKRSYSICWGAGGSGVERLHHREWAGLRSRKDDLVLHSPNEESWWRSGTVTSFRLVFLPPALLSRLALEVWDRDCSTLAARPGFIRDPSLRYMLDMCFNRASDLHDPLTPLELDAWANVLGLEVLRRFAAPPEAKAPSRERLSEARLERVKERIEAGLAEPLRLPELAAEAGYSPYYFARAFKATIGQSPHQYVLERRIERAKVLLRKGDMNLAEIATVCGFSSQSHFSSQFRARVGVTPTAFRAED